MQVDQDQVLEQDHHQAQSRCNRGGDQELPSLKLGRAPSQPAVDGQQRHRHHQPDIAAVSAEAPASVVSTASSGAKDALTIGQVAASAPRMQARIGSWPPADHLELPPPYRPEPGQPVYEVRVGERVA